MIQPNTMQRASTLIRGLGLPGDTLTAEDLACTAWAGAVGKKVAAHTRAAKLVRTKLVVEVEDIIWQRQLFALTWQILRNLTKGIGPGVVEHLEFKIVPRRREPARAVISTSTPLFDDADAIADPVMRDIYRAARKRAQAS